MPKRLFWFTAGAGAGAAGASYVRRKLRQATRREVPAQQGATASDRVQAAASRARAAVAEGAAAVRRYRAGTTLSGAEEPKAAGPGLDP